MSWIFITLFSALTITFQDVFSKKAATGAGVVLVAWARMSASLPFLLLLFFFIEIPELSVDFFVTVLALIPLEITALVLYVYAIKTSPLSVTLPFLALSPIFVILTAYIFLGETVTVTGAFGISLIAVGSYLIFGHKIKDCIVKPIASIGSGKGSLMMILVAIIYSVTSVLGKRAVLLSSPEFFGPFYIGVVSLAMIPVVLAIGPGPKKLLFDVKANLKMISLIGLFGALSYISHFWAITLTEAAYMISVKRTSLLFGIVFGRLFFEEAQFGMRLVAGSLILAGLFTVSFF